MKYRFYAVQCRERWEVPQAAWGTWNATARDVGTSRLAGGLAARKTTWTAKYSAVSDFPDGRELAALSAVLRRPASSAPGSMPAESTSHAGWTVLLADAVAWPVPGQWTACFPSTISAIHQEDMR
jgi:hypothetical protein